MQGHIKLDLDASKETSNNLTLESTSAFNRRIPHKQTTKPISSIVLNAWIHYIYIHIYRCLQFCAHVSNCFAFFPAEPHRADLLRKQWSFVAYPPFLGRILKNARPDSFTEGSVSLEDLPWAKCLPTVKYLNRFDSGQRVGRHIRMSWWPLYKLSDLHSTAFLDDFWHVLYIISAHFMNICICLPQLVYIHNAIASNLSHAPI